MLVVADTSALVALAAADSLDLLDQLFDGVRDPAAVQTELLVPGKSHQAVLQDFLRGKVVSVDLTRYVIAAPGLGLGELEARCTRPSPRTSFWSTTSGRGRSRASTPSRSSAAWASFCSPKAPD